MKNTQFGYIPSKTVLFAIHLVLTWIANATDDIIVSYADQYLSPSDYDDSFSFERSLGRKFNKGADYDYLVPVGERERPIDTKFVDQQMFQKLMDDVKSKLNVEDQWRSKDVQQFMSRDSSSRTKSDHFLVGLKDLLHKKLRNKKKGFDDAIAVQQSNTILSPKVVDLPEGLQAMSVDEIKHFIKEGGDEKRRERYPSSINVTNYHKYYPPQHKGEKHHSLKKSINNSSFDNIIVKVFPGMENKSLKSDDIQQEQDYNQFDDSVYYNDDVKSYPAGTQWNERQTASSSIPPAVYDKKVYDSTSGKYVPFFGSHPKEFRGLKKKARYNPKIQYYYPFGAQRLPSNTETVFTQRPQESVEPNLHVSALFPPESCTDWGCQQQLILDDNHNRALGKSLKRGQYFSSGQSDHNIKNDSIHFVTISKEYVPLTNWPMESNQDGRQQNDAKNTDDNNRGIIDSDETPKVSDADDSVNQTRGGRDIPQSDDNERYEVAQLFKNRDRDVYVPVCTKGDLGCPAGLGRQNDPLFNGDGMSGNTTKTNRHFKVNGSDGSLLARGSL